MRSMLSPSRTIVEKNFLRRRRAIEFSHSLERRDPYRGIYRERKVVDALRHEGLWLWIPDRARKRSRVRDGETGASLRGTNGSRECAPDDRLRMKQSSLSLRPWI